MSPPTARQSPATVLADRDHSPRLILRPLHDMLLDHGKALEELFERTPNPHPFLHPDCVQAHFSETTDVWLAALSHQGNICCAGVLDPWALNVGRIPRTSLTWRLRGRRIFAKGLLWDGTPESVGSWLQELRPLLRHHSWAGLMLEAAAVDAPLWSAINDSLSRKTTGLKLLRPQALQPRWRIHLPDSVDEYWSTQFKGKTRNTLRRKRKKLGNYRVEVITNPTDIEEFLAAASAVSEHTWQSRQLGLRVKNNEQERHLFRTLAERCEFRAHLMLVDERPVAFAINTSHDGYLHFEETGFLPELSHLSPGTVLISELVDDVIGCGEYHTIDFGLGHADYKQLFSNQQTQSADVWLMRNSPVTAVAAGLISAQESLRNAAKKSLQKSGVLRRLKKLKRGH